MTEVRSAYLLIPYWAFGDDLGTWAGDYALELGRMLHNAEPLLPSWSGRAVRLDPPGAPIPVISSHMRYPVLHDIEGDAHVREILGASGEWLPLSGEGEGYSMFHSLTVVQTRPGKAVQSGPNRIFAFDESQVKANTAAHIKGLPGLVWFEGDPDEGLRPYVHEARLEGLGFVKCWDDTGDYQYDPMWYTRTDSGFLS